MDIKLNLKRKEINPGVINLRQYSNNTDLLVFVMEEYIYEQTDLSKLDVYAVCDMGGRIDEVKLQKEIVDSKLHITWKVTGYTTQQDGHINYLISFKNNIDGSIWNSYKAIILVNSSIDPDSYIPANYPSILQQWEQRMNNIDKQVDVDLEEIRDAVETTTTNAVASKENADTAARASENANKSLSNIQELLGYEPVEAIDLEVAQARGEYDLLGLRLDAIEASASSGQTTINRETFIATQNQHTFTLTKGSYTLGGNHLNVAVNGIQQPYEAIVEVNTNTFGLKENFTIDEGDVVDVTYYLISASPNMETPDGAQKKANEVKTWAENELKNVYSKTETTQLFDKKPIKKTTTLSANKWSNSSYIVDMQGITSDSVQHVGVSETATQAQYEAFTSASMIGGTQSANRFTLKAMGEVPKVDIPIMVVIQGV